MNWIITKKNLINHSKISAIYQAKMFERFISLTVTDSHSFVLCIIVSIFAYLGYM